MARAVELGRKGETERTTQLLDEACHRFHIFSRAENSSQLTAQFEVASAYLMVLPEKSFAIFESMIEQLDGLAGATVLVNGFLTDADTPMARADELILRNIHITLDLSQYSETFGILAHENFARLEAAADRFRRPEVRAISRLLIAKSILSNPKSRPK